MLNVRRRLLVRSVQRLLPGDETVDGAVVLWTLSARSILVSAAVGVLFFAVSPALFDVERSSLAIWSVLLAALVGALLTRFRVVALTDRGFVVLVGSSIRSIATEFLERLPEGSEPVKLGGNVATSDWSVGGEIHTISKRGEKELERLMARHRDR